MELLPSADRSADRNRHLILVAAAILLTLWQHLSWRVNAISIPEYLAYLMVTPLEAAFTSGFNRAHDFALAFTSVPRLAEENRRLKEERDELEAQRIMTVDVRLQIKAMREKLGFDPEKPFDKVAAEVISRSSGGQSRWIKIRAGHGKPLEVGNVVCEACGLVGRVTDAQGGVGQVVLLVDPRHAVRGKDLRTGEEGMVHAASEFQAGPNRLRLEKTRSGAQIAVGDIIVTSDLGETYPGGLPIGVVESVRRSPASVSSLVAIIRPYVDFDRLDYVYVLRAGQG